MVHKTKEKLFRTGPIPGSNGSSKEMSVIKLPKPKMVGGLSVPKALQKRRTTREISERKLALQILSNLLWSAWGVNRKSGPFEMPGRTAASASNSQEIDLYVAMETGVYLYNALDHTLEQVLEDDLRPLAIGSGQAGLLRKAPVQLIYVADVDRLVHTQGYPEPGLHDPEVQKSYYFVDTGLIAGNVFLFAASYGLAAWFHNCNKPALTKKLNLRPDQRVLFGQTVGYRKNK